MPAPEWGSFSSIVDGSLKPALLSDPDQDVLKEWMAEDRGLTILDVKKKSDYSSDTTRNGECFDEQETTAVPTPVANADDHLSKIPSSILLVDLDMLPLKHSAILVQLLTEEVCLCESTPGGSHDHAVFSMRTTDCSAELVPGAKASPNNLPMSW